MKNFINSVEEILKTDEDDLLQIFSRLQYMSDYVFNKKLEFITNDLNSLDLKFEKSHFDNSLKNNFYNNSDNFKKDFMKKLYVLLEDFEKLELIDKNPSNNIENAIDEVYYIYNEYNRLKKLEPKRSIQQIYNDVQEMGDREFNPTWFKRIYNTGGAIMPSEERFKRLFNYYLKLEDYEKCEFLKKAKEAHDNYKKHDDGGDAFTKLLPKKPL